MSEVVKDFLVPIAAAIVVIVIAVALTVGIFALVGTFGSGSDFESRNAFVVKCLASDLYTRDECVLMAGDE